MVQSSRIGRVAVACLHHQRAIANNMGMGVTAKNLDVISTQNASIIFFRGIIHAKSIYLSVHGFRTCVGVAQVPMPTSSSPQ